METRDKRIENYWGKLVSAGIVYATDAAFDEFATACALCEDKLAFSSTGAALPSELENVMQEWLAREPTAEAQIHKLCEELAEERGISVAEAAPYVEADPRHENLFFAYYKHCDSQPEPPPARK